MTVLRYAAVIIISYLLGSVSSGLIVAKLFHGPNLRQVGSGNTGTTNVMRSMGKKAGYLTFVCDYLKAILSCLIGQILLGPEGARLGGLFCVFGHNWPVFFGFKGGKGVCSSMAVVLFCFPKIALLVYVVGLEVMLLTKYVSAGSIAGATTFLMTVLLNYWGDWGLLLWAAVIALLLIVRHHANIQRLLNDKENKIGQKKK